MSESDGGEPNVYYFQRPTGPGSCSNVYPKVSPPGVMTCRTHVEESRLMYLALPQRKHEDVSIKQPAREGQMPSRCRCSAGVVRYVGMHTCRLRCVRTIGLSAAFAAVW